MIDPRRMHACGRGTYGTCKGGCRSDNGCMRNGCGWNERSTADSRETERDSVKDLRNTTEKRWTDRGCGCGCGGNSRTASDSPCGKKKCMDDTCQKEMEYLRKLEFAIVDVALYLDAYPNSDCALAYYHKLLDERDSLRKMIKESCGPLTIYENANTTDWDWVEGPWPWHPDAN